MSAAPWKMPLRWAITNRSIFSMAYSSRDVQERAADDSLAPSIPIRVVPRPRRIIPGLTVSFMAGLLIAAVVHIPALPVVGVLIVCLFLSVAVRQSVLSNACIHLAVMCFGGLWLTSGNDAH